MKRSIFALALIGATLGVSIVNAAQDNISVDRRQSSTTSVEFNNITLSQDGYLEVRAMHTGQAGDVLATQKMKAGINRGRRIILKFPQGQGVFLLLYTDDHVLVDSEKVTINRRKVDK